MAVSIDATAPATNPTTITGSTASTFTTGSFTPPANTLLVAVACMGYSGSTTGTPFTISDSLSGTWQQDAVEAPSSGGLPEVQICSQWIGGSPASMTVTLTTGTQTKGKQLTIFVLDGTASSGWKGGTAVSTTTLDGSITTTKVGSLVIVSGGNDSTGTFTADARTTTKQNFTDSSESLQLIVGYSTATTTTPGATTFGWTGTTSSPSWCAVEYLPASGSFVKALVLTQAAVGRSYYR